MRRSNNPKWTCFCVILVLASTYHPISASQEDEEPLQFEIIKPANIDTPPAAAAVAAVAAIAPVAAAAAAPLETFSGGRSVSRPNPASPSSSAPTRCANVMPGLNRLRRGVDVAKLDLMSLAPNSGDDGFRKPIVDFTCAEGKTVNVRIPGGQFRTYDLPDEIWDVAALPGGFLSERVEIFKSSRQVQKSMAASAGIDVLGGIFSTSASYAKMSSSLTNESRYLESVESVVSASRVDLVPFWGFELSRYAKQFVDRRLPDTFEEDPARYADFISYFGTHYFAHGKFGGVIKLLLETETSYFRGRTESKVKAEAGGMFKNILKAKGGYDGATVTVDAEFTRKTQKTIRYNGGDTNLLDAEGLRRWQPTVAENPWLFGGELKPLYDLFDDAAAAKKKAMARAIEVHLDKARLNAAKNLVYSQMSSMRGDTAAVAKLLKYLTDCDALLNVASPEHAIVDQLASEIERELVVIDWHATLVAAVTALIHG